jgi:hypothetical protein
MKRQSAAACLLALVLTVSGCASPAPKDSSPVALPAPSPTASATPSEPEPEPSEPAPSDTPAETTPAPDVIEPPAEGDPSDGASEVPDEFKEMVVPEDLMDVTADDMYGPGINDFMTDVETGDKGRKVGVCRTAAVIVSELPRTEIEDRRASMTPEDLETLTDFIDVCGRILAS